MPKTRSKADRFSALDIIIVLLYLVLILGVGFNLIPVSGLLQSLPFPPAVSVLLGNLAANLVLAILAVIAARKALGRAGKLVRQHPWASLAVVFLAEVVAYLLTAVVVVAMEKLSPGSVLQTSVNQEEVQALIKGNPLWLYVPLLVVIGPFLEEYLFRHLLVGKLSNYLNVWLCGLISVVLFALLHVAGKEAPSLTVLAPYLVLGLILVLAYIQRGKNLLVSYGIHAVHNLLAVLVLVFASGAGA